MHLENVEQKVYNAYVFSISYILIVSLIIIKISLHEIYLLIVLGHKGNIEETVALGS